MYRLLLAAFTVSLSSLIAATDLSVDHASGGGASLPRRPAAALRFRFGGSIAHSQSRGGQTLLRLNRDGSDRPLRFDFANDDIMVQVLVLSEWKAHAEFSGVTKILRTPDGYKPEFQVAEIRNIELSGALGMVDPSDPKKGLRLVRGGHSMTVVSALANPLDSSEVYSDDLPFDKERLARQLQSVARRNGKGRFTGNFEKRDGATVFVVHGFDVAE